MFNIGDSVYYYSEVSNKKFYGIVLGITDYTTTIKFEEDFMKAYSIKDTYVIANNLIKHGSKKPELPTEAKVANKCKKLWNQSNWVKQHPQQAY